MSTYKVTPITQKFGLGEGPHWDIARQSLYFVDLLSKTPSINRYDNISGATFTATIDDVQATPSFIIPVEGTVDEFAISNNSGVVIVQWDGQSKKAIVKRTIIDSEPNKRSNDGKADPRGRIYYGYWSKKPFDAVIINNADGELCRHAPGETKNKVKLESGIGLPNGLTWNEKTNKFYYIDTLVNDIKEYDYDPKTGNISNRRVLIAFAKDGTKPVGGPDGMTIDSEGFLYVAYYGSSRVYKINPSIGQIVGEIVLPCTNIASVAFGGERLDELFVTTGSIQGTAHAQPAVAGAVFKVTGLNVKGLPMKNARL